jgi:hypothetical protein
LTSTEEALKRRKTSTHQSPPAALPRNYEPAIQTLKPMADASTQIRTSMEANLPTRDELHAVDQPFLDLIAFSPDKR